MCTTTDVYECAEIPGHGRRYAESFAVVLSSENMQTTGSNFPWRVRDMEAYIQLPLSLLAFFAPLSRTILLAARPWGEIDKHVIHISSAAAKQPTVVILFTFTSSCVCWLLTLEMLPCAFHTRRLRDIHSHIDTIPLFSAFYRYTHHLRLDESNWKMLALSPSQYTVRTSNRTHRIFADARVDRLLRRSAEATDTLLNKSASFLCGVRWIKRALSDLVSRCSQVS